MKCKHCGAQLSDNAKFCGGCGKKVERETVKENTRSPISNEVHNQEKENGENKKKKAVLPIVLFLCVIIVGAGFFYYKNKGGVVKNAGTTNKKEIEKSKNNTVKEYEDFANGVWNNFSTYYEGYIYYTDDECLYKKNADTEEVEILYKMGEKSGAYSFFKIINNYIYLSFTNEEQDYNHKVIKLNCNGEEEKELDIGDCNLLYAYGKNLYCYEESYDEKTEESSVRLVKIDKNDNQEIIELPEKCIDSDTIMFSNQYLYYEEDDNRVNRLDITQGKDSVSEKVLDIGQNKAIYTMYVYQNKIYYSTYEDEAGCAVMNEYDMQTGKQTDDIGKKWFGEKYVGFILENARGDKLYILRYDEEDTQSGMLYSWDLKKEQLEEIEFVENATELDICKGYILYRDMSDEECGITNYIYRSEMEEESEI